MRRKSSRPAITASMRVKSLLIALSAALALTLFGAEPQSAEARPITCSVSATSTLPTKTQFRDYVTANGPVYTWAVHAPVSARCQSQLGKGNYLYRAQWTVRLQLTSGWPIGIDYSESTEWDRDALMQSWERSFFTTYGNGFETAPEEIFELSGLWTQSSSGVNETYLSELCFAERCTFSIERTGQFASVRDDAIPHIYTLIYPCMNYVPLGPEGEMETEACLGSGSRYAHPGTFGMQVTVSGTMTFEPLWTWRR